MRPRPDSAEQLPPKIRRKRAVTADRIAVLANPYRSGTEKETDLHTPAQSDTAWAALVGGRTALIVASIATAAGVTAGVASAEDTPGDALSGDDSTASSFSTDGDINFTPFDTLDAMSSPLPSVDLGTTSLQTHVDDSQPLTSQPLTSQPLISQPLISRSSIQPEPIRFDPGATRADPLTVAPSSSTSATEPDIDQTSPISLPATLAGDGPKTGSPGGNGATSGADDFEDDAGRSQPDVATAGGDISDPGTGATFAGEAISVPALESGVPAASAADDQVASGSATANHPNADDGEPGKGFAEAWVTSPAVDQRVSSRTDDTMVDVQATSSSTAVVEQVPPSSEVSTVSDTPASTPASSTILAQDGALPDVLPSSVMPSQDGATAAPQSYEYVPGTSSQSIRLVGSGRPGVTRGLVTRSPVAGQDGMEVVIVNPAREPGGTVSALVPIGSPFEAGETFQTYQVPKGTPLVRVTRTEPGLPGSPQPEAGLAPLLESLGSGSSAPVTTAASPPADGPGEEEQPGNGAEPQGPKANAEPTQTERLIRATTYAATGRGVVWMLLKGGLDRSITLPKYAPVAGVDFVKDLVVGGALTPITGFGDILGPVVNGARGAAITQGVNLATRNALNPGLNAAANAYNSRRNPGAPPANIRADVVVGANNPRFQPTIPLLDPGRLTISPDVAANTPPPRRLTVTTTPTGSLSPEVDSTGNLARSARPAELFSARPTERISGPVEIVPNASNSVRPLPARYTDGVYPEGDITAAKLTDAPSAARNGAYRISDATAIGVNMAVPATQAIANGLLRATGQDDNPWVSVPANAAAVGVGVGVPISIAQGTIVRPAFKWPTVQALVAEVVTRGVMAMLPEDQQRAVNDTLQKACSDENVMVGAAKQFVCSAGQNQKPPTNPPANTGGAVVTNGFSAATGNPPTTATVARVPSGDLVPSPALRTTVESKLVGEGLVGPKLVGPKLVGEGLVGPKLVGPKLVGPKLVGEGLVGPRLNPIQQGLDWAGENVVAPVGRAYEQAQEAGRESLRTTIAGSEPLDGVLGFGVTRHRVEFMGGGRGLYDPEGNLLSTERGDPPVKVDGWKLFSPGGTRGATVPARTGSGGMVVPRGIPVIP